MELLGGRGRCGDRIAAALERHAWLRTCLLMLVLLGTCALVGDGILTPAISGDSLVPQPSLSLQTNAQHSLLLILDP